ncbi:hypothetical protein [Nocardiopsis synnemataformans]|uniref:hypothetical protein n=1 Tax=Nocardiopsis synnemataformans TaxID=61305 RepID=UPI003EC0FE7E
MNNPIPSPRRSEDVRPISRPLPRRTPLVGPACLTCDHPSCRTRRAQQLPRLGGHRAEFAREHAQAAAVQARHRDLTIWWGEATQSFWIAGPSGLTEAADIDALLLILRPHGTPRITPQTVPDTDPPAARPWVRPAMGPAPASAPGPITTLAPRVHHRPSAHSCIRSRTRFRQDPQGPPHRPPRLQPSPGLHAPEGSRITVCHPELLGMGNISPPEA